ncbi:a-type inclusion protein [Anaeramoeba flamelloides]|uniref:A-type inclusion protein n=1 Tax=Anaeramoeba flamelloides TaxID=1746091 RepID=A0AAV8AF22_9EUKA|nr:a-type inclusion protein [Anaeramoeba flamelloides]
MSDTQTLLTWINIMLGVEVTNLTELLDGVYLTNILSDIVGKEIKINTENKENSAKIKNLENVYKELSNIWESKFNSILPEISVSDIIEKNDQTKLANLIVFLMISSMNCTKKEEYLLKIKNKNIELHNSLLALPTPKPQNKRKKKSTTTQSPKKLDPKTLIQKLRNQNKQLKDTIQKYKKLAEKNKDKITELITKNNTIIGQYNEFKKKVHDEMKQKQETIEQLNNSVNKEKEQEKQNLKENEKKKEKLIEYEKEHKILKIENEKLVNKNKTLDQQIFEFQMINQELNKCKKQLENILKENKKLNKFIQNYLKENSKLNEEEIKELYAIKETKIKELENEKIIYEKQIIKNQKIIRELKIHSEEFQNIKNENIKLKQIIRREYQTNNPNSLSVVNNTDSSTDPNINLNTDVDGKKYQLEKEILKLTEILKEKEQKLKQITERKTFFENANDENLKEINELLKIHSAYHHENQLVFSAFYNIGMNVEKEKQELKFFSHLFNYSPKQDQSSIEPNPKSWLGGARNDVMN